MRRIGRHVSSPRRHDVKPSYSAAKIVDDAIAFHGATVRVKVHDAYPSRPFGDRINIAAGRSVELHEGPIRIWIDDHLVSVTLMDERRRRKKTKSPPPYGALADELPKSLLKTFPILYSYHRDGTFEGVTVFRWKRAPPRAQRRKTKR